MKKMSIFVFFPSVLSSTPVVANVTHMPPLDNGTAMSLPIITHPPWTTAHNPPEESSSWSSGMPDNVTARPTSGQHSTGFVTSLAQPVSENHQNSTVASTSVDNTFPPCCMWTDNTPFISEVTGLCNLFFYNFPKCHIASCQQD